MRWTYLTGTAQVYRLDSYGLRISRPRHLVRDAPSGKKKQRDQRAPANLRIMMRPRTRGRPSGSLPARHAHNLRRRGQRNDAVDFAVRVQMVLAPIDFFAFHVDGRDAEVAALLAGCADPAATVSGTVDLVCCEPVLVGFQPVSDESDEFVVEWIAGTVVAVQSCLEVFAGGSFRRGGISLAGIWE